MADKGWKAAERRMARDVGCERIPVTGERDGADFAAGPFAYQLKVRKEIPDWLWGWFSGIRGAAERRSQVGALVLRKPRMPDEDALVIVRWKDWVDLHGHDEARRVDAVAFAREMENPTAPNEHLKTLAARPGFKRS